MKLLVLLTFMLTLEHKTNGYLKKDEMLAPQINSNDGIEEKLLLSPKIYSEFFKERRVEQHAMIKNMLKSTYDKNFKLLKIAYPRIMQVLEENNATMAKDNYKPSSGFPKQKSLQVAVILLLENCCLAAENVLHFPEISQRIFANQNISNTKSIFNWCVEFVFAYPQIIDEPTVKLMELLKQEINVELRDNDYNNPYYKTKSKENSISSQIISKIKPKKKLKKGPQLAGSKIEL